jgi:hypothetical protein
MRMWRFLGLLFLGTAGIVMRTVWFFPMDIRFGAQNPFWNGLKDFEKEFRAMPLGLLPPALRRSVQSLRGNGSGGPRGTLGGVVQREIEALEGSVAKMA